MSSPSGGGLRRGVLRLAINSHVTYNWIPDQVRDDSKKALLAMTSCKGAGKLEPPSSLFP